MLAMLSALPRTVWLIGLISLVIAFASSWLWLLLIRFSDRVGKGLRSSPRDALLAASVLPEQRGLGLMVHSGLLLFALFGFYGLFMARRGKSTGGRYCTACIARYRLWLV